MEERETSRPGNRDTAQKAFYVKENELDGAFNLLLAHIILSDDDVWLAILLQILSKHSDFLDLSPHN